MESAGGAAKDMGATYNGGLAPGRVEVVVGLSGGGCLSGSTPLLSSLQGRFVQLVGAARGKGGVAVLADRTGRNLFWGGFQEAMQGFAALTAAAYRRGPDAAAMGGTNEPEIVVQYAAVEHLGNAAASLKLLLKGKKREIRELLEHVRLCRRLAARNFGRLMRPPGKELGYMAHLGQMCQRIRQARGLLGEWLNRMPCVSHLGANLSGRVEAWGAYSAAMGKHLRVFERAIDQFGREMELSESGLLEMRATLLPHYNAIGEATQAFAGYTQQAVSAALEHPEIMGRIQAFYTVVNNLTQVTVESVWDDLTLLPACKMVRDSGRSPAQILSLCRRIERLLILASEMPEIPIRPWLERIPGRELSHKQKGLQRALMRIGKLLEKPKLSCEFGLPLLRATFEGLVERAGVVACAMPFRQLTRHAFIDPAEVDGALATLQAAANDLRESEGESPYTGRLLEWIDATLHGYALAHRAMWAAARLTVEEMAPSFQPPALEAWAPPEEVEAESDEGAPPEFNREHLSFCRGHLAILTATSPVQDSRLEALEALLDRIAAATSQPSFDRLVERAAAIAREVVVEAEIGEVEGLERLLHLLSYGTSKPKGEG